MTKKLLNKFKKITSYMLVISMVACNFSFLTIVQASGAALTIGSQSAANGDTINVPINASGFIDVAGIDFRIEYNNTLLTYTGYTPAALSLTVNQINNVNNQVIVNWHDGSNPLNINNGALLILNFNVISENSVDANIIFSGTKEINNSAGNPITADFVNGVITLNPDQTPTTLSAITPIPTPANDNTPEYTFSSSEAGAIAYSGSCLSSTATASVGNNTIIFNQLSDGTYSDCAITVTDAGGNASNVLAVNAFTVDTAKPTGTIIINGGATHTNSHDAVLTLSAANDLSGVVEMNMANGTHYYGWETYTTSKNWTLSAEDGNKTVRVRFKDRAGNETATGIPANIIVDTIVPTAQETTQATTPTSDTTSDVGITVESGASWQIKNGETVLKTGVGTGAEQIITLPELGEETYSLILIATDEAGNTTTVNLSEFTIDLSVSPINLSALPSNPTNQTNANIAVSGDGIIFYKYKLDGADYGKEISIGANIILSDLTEGAHTLFVKGRDDAGNWSDEISETWTIDLTAPNSPAIVNPAGTIILNSDTYLIIGTAENNSLVEIYRGTELAGSKHLGIGETDYSIEVSLAQNSNNNFTAIAVDLAGNKSASSTVFTITEDSIAPTIILIGESAVNIFSGGAYVDAGAAASDNHDGNITANVAVANPVNTNVVGIYIITYNVSDLAGNQAVAATRTVNVNQISDTTAPVITLIGSNPVNVEAGSAYTDAGATAIDDVDGDITAKIVAVNPANTNVLGVYTITYNVSDLAGNPATEVTRTVNVIAPPDKTPPDTTAPVITLNGGDMNIYKGTAYAELGAVAADNVDTAMQINIGGDTVDTATVGIYVITYNVSDSLGNKAAEAKRTVAVLAVEEGQTVLSSEINLDTIAPEVLIGSNAPANSTIIASSSVVNGKLNVSTLLSGVDVKSVELQTNITIQSATNVGDVNVKIPSGQISADKSWTGEINFPQIKENSSVAVAPDSGKTANVSSVIEIGFDEVKLNFDKAVRIELKNQAGKYAGYSRGGTFTQIIQTCASDAQAAGDALSADGDCKIDVGSDLVIWTKHFTKFITYTQTAVQQPSSGGGYRAKTKPVIIEVKPKIEFKQILDEILDEEVKVLGVEFDEREAQLADIEKDAKDVYGGDVVLTLANAGGLKRDSKAESAGYNNYTSKLINGITGLSSNNVYAITNFVVYGTKTTQILGAGERAGVINSYKRAFGKLPSSQVEWEDAVKIANGRWPSETNSAAEVKAKEEFKKIYKREADMANQNDNAAVTVIAYGLRPSDRNPGNEKIAANIFKAIYKYAPTSVADWDIVRAIAYSGAAR